MRKMISLAILVVLAGPLLPAQKRKKEEATQVLALPKEPPSVAWGETAKLVFQVTPLSNKGLLTSQTRDAVKALLKMNGGAQVVHIRAFVAGSGDLRRVPQIISEVLTDKKMELPSVSVVLGGGLGMVGSQIVLEAVSIGRKDVNRNGLRFAAGHIFTAPDPLSKAQPLVEQALDALAKEFAGGEAVQVTCYASNVEPEAGVAIAKRFPGAAADVIQTLRGPGQAYAGCEGIARGGPVNAARLAFTGTQIAFGSAEKDVALAFQRFDQQLAAQGEVVLTNIYPLSNRIVETAKKVRPTIGTLPVVLFEGLASMDASFAVDAVAVAKQ